MLSINSTLHEIEQAHQRDNMNMKQIASALRVGENKLRRILTAVGFEFDASIRKWRYTRLDEGEDIRDRSFWSLEEYGVGNPDNTGKLRDSNKSNPGNTRVNNTGNNSNIKRGNIDNIGNTKQPKISNTGNLSNIKSSDTSNIQFTQDEILILKELAARHATATPVTDSTDILEAIQGVPKGKTTKKTFALNNDVIDRLDAFCDTHRIKKSDFVVMAIQDALNKFNK